MQYRRSATSVLGTVALAATAIGFFGTPAAAAPSGPCYAVGSYSFKDQTVNSRVKHIHVFRGGSCSGGEIATGKAAYSTNSGGEWIALSAKDSGCDNIGITVYVHGHSVSSTGCGTQENKTINRDRIGSPKNFWVNVAGRTNSNALNLPRG